MLEPMRSAAAHQTAYLVLAIVGAVGTWFFNLQMAELSTFFTQVWDAPLSSSLAVDLLVVVLSFYVLMAAEGRRLKMSPLVLVGLGVLTWLVAVACALPLFLFFRERALARRRAAGDGVAAGRATDALASDHGV